MVKFLICAWATLSVIVSGYNVGGRSSHVIHEKRAVDDNANTWLKGPRADPELIVRAKIGLTQMDLHRGHDLLMEVSDPSSERYGRHYSTQEVFELFAPHDSTIDLVTAWLAEEGQKATVTGNRQWLLFDAKVSTLEDMLSAEYHEYEHPKTGKISIGCEHYSVPHHLREHIDIVSPGLTMIEAMDSTITSYAAPKLEPYTFPSNESEDSQLGRCGEAISPACVRKLYGIEDKVIHSPGDGNSIGVYEGYLDFLNQADLDKLLRKFEPSFPRHLYPKTFLVDGAPNPKRKGHRHPGGESALDFQAIYPIAYPIPIQLFQSDDYYWESRGSSGVVNTMLEYIDGSYCNRTAFGISGDIQPFDPKYPDRHKSNNPWRHRVQCGIAKPPRVISISYSATEEYLSAAYMRRQCSEFLKLGMQGVSIFAATGDYGVSGNGRVCLGKHSSIFAPLALTDCPYVTAVGSTELPSNAIAGKHPERATIKYPSSGGFSNIFTRPDWQNKAISNYFKKHNPPYKSYKTVNNPTAKNVKGRYNRAGRGIPDVSASGAKFISYYNGKPFLGYGTSVSAPIWAAIVSRINGARIAAGKGTVGFINPTLYSHPDVLNDITIGGNPGCHTAGFQCVKGWDPVTGLGTPNYPKLKKLLLSLN